MGITQDRGSLGEKIAKEFLENLEYIFITSNWRCKAGEIDLIFDDKDTRVFVEVRSRSVTQFGEGLETVLWQKQKKLIRAARLYQVQEQYWGNARFDVVSIILQQGKPPIISHIKDAFDTTGVS